MEKCDVFFDGKCPLCKREINLYSSLDKGKNIRWVDISDRNIQVPDGYKRSTLLSKFHVRDKEGNWHSGSKGFFVVWNELSGFKFLGKLGQYRIVVIIADILYAVFLFIRPIIQLPLQIYDFFKKKV